MNEQNNDKNVSPRSQRAGVLFSVGHIHRCLRRGNYGSRIASVAPVYLAAVIEYLVAEVLYSAGDTLRDNESRIIPRHIRLAIHNNKELNELFEQAMIAHHGGVTPNIYESLLSEKIMEGEEGASHSIP